jgi:hypothetical protein
MEPQSASPLTLKVQENIRLCERYREVAPEIELRTTTLLERFSSGLRQRGDQNRHRYGWVAQHGYGFRIFGDSSPGLRFFKSAPRIDAAFRQIKPDLDAVLYL